MAKTKTRYYYEEAYKQQRITYCTFLFILLKALLFVGVLTLAVLEGSIIKRKLIHSNEKSLHHTGTLMSSRHELMDSNDFVRQSRHKSNFVLYNNVKLFTKEKETIVNPRCLKEKICMQVENCQEPKCLIVKESLVEENEEILRITDEDKRQMLKKFMFYVRPRTDYIYSGVVPQNEETLMFYPSKKFNVFTLQSIFEEFVNSRKKFPNDEISEQNWQNSQRAQEIIGQLKVPENPSGISNPLNRVSLR
jgi:hypothetical protein